MRRAGARVALAVLAVSATLAVGGVAGVHTSSSAASAHAVSAASAAQATSRGRDRTPAVVNPAALTTEWAALQSRGPDVAGGFAVLLGAASLVVARRWLGIAGVAHRSSWFLRAFRAGIRAPPAFA